MPKSKRDRKVTLSKTQKKVGLETKQVNITINTVIIFSFQIGRPTACSLKVKLKISEIYSRAYLRKIVNAKFSFLEEYKNQKSLSHSSVEIGKPNIFSHLKNIP